MWLTGGHGDTASEAFRHWDTGGTVDAACSRCHTDEGYLNQLQIVDEAKNVGTVTTTLVGIPAAQSDGIACNACHTSASAPDVTNLRTVAALYMPGSTVGTNPYATEIAKPSQLSSVTNTTAWEKSKLCMTCHQARSSTVQVTATLTDPNADGDTADNCLTNPDAVCMKNTAPLGFINLHYLGAAATQFGGVAQGGAQVEGKTYVGWGLDHSSASAVHNGGKVCTQCHDPHANTVLIAGCASGCHAGEADPNDPRTYTAYSQDYDGDGTADGGFTELTNLAQLLYAQMIAYTNPTTGSLSPLPTSSICYSPTTYPYWLVDTDGNGTCDAGETTGWGASGSGTGFSANLMIAAYNYQMWVKDPGTFAHNPDYIAQLLIDSIELLGGDVTNYNRPVAP